MIATKFTCDYCNGEFKHQDNIVTVTENEYIDPKATIRTLVYKTFPDPKHYHRKCYTKLLKELV